MYWRLARLQKFRKSLWSRPLVLLVLTRIGLTIDSEMRAAGHTKSSARKVRYEILVSILVNTYHKLPKQWNFITKHVNVHLKFFSEFLLEEMIAGRED